MLKINVMLTRMKNDECNESQAYILYRNNFSV